PLGCAREPLHVRGAGDGIRRRRARPRAGARAPVPRGRAGAGAGRALPRSAARVPLAAHIVGPLAELRLLLRRGPGRARRRAEPPAGSRDDRPPPRRSPRGARGVLLAGADRADVLSAPPGPRGAGAWAVRP